MNSTVDLDLKHVWHPCSQMKDYQYFPPVEISHARGDYCYLTNGQKIIDAISSWWCKHLGHNHPAVQQAIQQQLTRFDHVMLANTCHDVIAQLASVLSELSPSLNKVSFASDGSCAVEMALKMSVHAQQLLGRPEKNRFLAFAHGYHGETCLALAVSDLGIYRKPYESLLPKVEFLQPLPYVNHCADPLWLDCGAHWREIENSLNAQAHHVAAIIFEPILQGAAGMRIYSADLLKRLRRWCDEHQVFLIADEIMTGFGRTGLPLAIQHSAIEPDFLCLAKGLTAGSLPMSAMLTRQTIFDLFFDDYQSGKAFLHSHTHTGNALAAAAALAAMKMYRQHNFFCDNKNIQQRLVDNFNQVAENTGVLTNIRHLGMMVAGDLILTPEQLQQRMPYQIFQKALSLGALLRPLGNTIYWLPPLNVAETTLDELADITEQAIAQCL